MTGIAAVASGGAVAARARRDHGEHVARLGQEGDAETDRLYAADQIRRGAGAQSGGATAPGTPTLRRATAVSDRPRALRELFHLALGLEEPRDGRATTLTTAPLSPQVVGGVSRTSESGGIEQSPGVGA